MISGVYASFLHKFYGKPPDNTSVGLDDIRIIFITEKLNSNMALTKNKTIWKGNMPGLELSGLVLTTNNGPLLSEVRKIENVIYLQSRGN